MKENLVSSVWMLQYSTRAREKPFYLNRKPHSQERVRQFSELCHSNCYCNCYSRPLYLGKFVVPFQTMWWYSWENRCFQVFKWSRVYKWMIFRWIKSNSLENTTWSEIGKQIAPCLVLCRPQLNRNGFHLRNQSGEKDFRFPTFHGVKIHFHVNSTPNSKPFFTLAKGRKV